VTREEWVRGEGGWGRGEGVGGKGGKGRKGRIYSNRISGGGGGY
jgi:hypothetical protein